MTQAVMLNPAPQVEDEDSTNLGQCCTSSVAVESHHAVTNEATAVASLSLL